MWFRSPVGAVRDVKELEYLAALHQTDHSDLGAYLNGSIEATDVKAFLMSRYGIQVSKDQVREIIFQGLAGGEMEGDDSIDLMEIVSILVIPLLVKVNEKMSGKVERWSVQADDKKQLQPPPNIITDILTTMLQDTLGGESPLETPPKLTPDLLKAILIEHDEFDIAKDNGLIEKMILAAKGDKDEVVLDAKTFSKALTGDVSLYDVENETRYTSIYSDVFGTGDEDDEEESEVKGDLVTKQKSTLSQIDFVSDNVLSWEHAVLMWLTVIFSYWLYMFGSGSEFKACENDTFGCTVANAIVLWIQIMLKLTILGSIVGIGLSMGNGTIKQSWLGPLIGLTAIALFIFFPAFYSIDNFILDTEIDDGFFNNVKYILPTFGCLLGLFQFKNLANLCIDKDMLPKRVQLFFLGSNGRKECWSKQAGIYKMNQMVKNAYELHIPQDKESQMKDSFKNKSSRALDLNESAEEGRKASTKATALENYSNMMNETEEIGGFFWAWKGFLSGSLQRTEGIWLSSRLMAAVAILVVTVMIVFVWIVLIFGSVIQQMYPDLTVQFSDTCFSTFDYDNCYFPYGEGFYTGVGICRGVRLNGPECLPLFYEIPVGSEWKAKSCEILDQAYEVVASLVPSNFTCGSIFGSVESILNSNPYYDVQFFGGCRTLSLADNETLMEYMADDPTLDEVAVEYCRNLTNFVYSSISSFVPSSDFTADAFDFCLDIYDTLNSTIPSMCDRSLYRAFETIRTYERTYSSDTDFCESVLSYCTPDPLDPTTGTCIIGESNLIPFQFQGPSCRSYPEINNTLTYYEEFVLPSLNTFTEILPKKWMVVTTAAVAIITATLVAIGTSLVYIPSSIHTLMKFRSGVIGSLREPAFIGYRSGLQNMAYLIGSMFWGLLVTTIFTVILVALSVFLLLWQATRDVVIGIIAQVIGVVITVLIKMAVCVFFMKYTHRGFYRKRPMAANIFSFAMECWYLGLTLAFIISRFFKFIISTGLYVGRIDRPVLADGLIFDIDSLPKIFRTNLLATEAHRHPYIELLGLMYLMKLRHKENFGSAGGSAWRLLFVTALMPWLKKRRIQESLLGDGVGQQGIGVAEEVLGGMLAINGLN